MSEKAPSKRIGEILLESGVITRQQLEEALAAQRGRKDVRLGQLLVEMRFCSEGLIRQALAHQLNIPPVNLSQLRIPAYVANLLPREMTERLQAIPISTKKEGEREILYVAMVDPTDRDALAEIERHTGRPVRLAVASHDDLNSAIGRYFVDKRRETARRTTESPPGPPPAGGGRSAAPVQAPSAPPPDKTPQPAPRPQPKPVPPVTPAAPAVPPSPKPDPRRDAVSGSRSMDDIFKESSLDDIFQMDINDIIEDRPASSSPPPPTIEPVVADSEHGFGSEKVQVGELEENGLEIVDHNFELSARRVRATGSVAGPSRVSPSRPATGEVNPVDLIAQDWSFDFEQPEEALPAGAEPPRQQPVEPQRTHRPSESLPPRIPPDDALAPPPADSTQPDVQDPQHAFDDVEQEVLYIYNILAGNVPHTKSSTERYLAKLVSNLVRLLIEKGTIDKKDILKEYFTRK